MDNAKIKVEKSYVYYIDHKKLNYLFKQINIHFTFNIVLFEHNTLFILIFLKKLTEKCFKLHKKKYLNNNKNLK